MRVPACEWPGNLAFSPSLSPLDYCNTLLCHPPAPHHLLPVPLPPPVHPLCHHQCGPGEGKSESAIPYIMPLNGSPCLQDDVQTLVGIRLVLILPTFFFIVAPSDNPQILVCVFLAGKAELVWPAGYPRAAWREECLSFIVASIMPRGQADISTTCHWG